MVRVTRWSPVAVVAAMVLGMMARGQEPADFIAKPTAEHKHLLKEVGTWKAKVKTWMAGPDQEPTNSEGSETNVMVGDLWLVTQFKGEFAGTPFEGRGQYGYDPQKGKYIGTWIDSMDAQMMALEGTYDDKARTLTMHATFEGPDGQPALARNVTEYKEDGSRVFTFSMKSDATGDDYVKVMEITYTKAK